MMAWTDRVLAAERTLSEGRHAKARAEFEALERSALSRADRVHAQLRQAESLRRDGRFGAAEALLRGVVRGSKGLDREQVAKLRYQLARVVLDAGRRSDGEAQLRELVLRLPDTIYAHRAFIYLRGALRQRDKGRYAEWCRTMYRERPDSALADNLIYEAARVFYERATPEGDRKAARLYRKILERWGFSTSPVWDDAIWELSLVHHRAGRYLDEIDLLRKLLATREFTTWIGSYEITNYKHALMRIGRVYFEDLRDYAAAVAVFRDFPGRFPLSRYKDDALWWLGHALTRAGKPAAGKAAHARLLKEYPESKYSRRVRQRRAPP